jgi:phospho-N-acetylmuramoyl-pentapeptide-transferase
VKLGEIVMGGAASLLICMFLGPKFIDYLRLKEFGQQIREEGPAARPARRPWAASRSSSRSRCRS